MKPLYWNINPEEVIKENENFKNLSSVDRHIQKNLAILCQEYNKVSQDIKEMIQSINGNNFEKIMVKIFDKEAYLAEIYFYLDNDILINTMEENILQLIRNDYLLSYYWKLSEMNQPENVVFFLEKWIEEKQDSRI